MILKWTPPWKLLVALFLEPSATFTQDPVLLGPIEATWLAGGLDSHGPKAFDWLMKWISVN